MRHCVLSVTAGVVVIARSVNGESYVNRQVLSNKKLTQCTGRTSVGVIGTPDRRPNPPHQCRSSIIGRSRRAPTPRVVRRRSSGGSRQQASSRRGCKAQQTCSEHRIDRCCRCACGLIVVVGAKRPGTVPSLSLAAVRCCRRREWLRRCLQPPASAAERRVSPGRDCGGNACCRTPRRRRGCSAFSKRVVVRQEISTGASA